MKKDNEAYMRICLELAGTARRNGKAAVGSIVVRNGVIIGKGEEGNEALPAFLAHAELIAINQAIQSIGKKDLADCALYTTVEPCVMCSYVIRSLKISDVIIGARTGGVGGVSSAYPILIADDIHPWGSPPRVVMNVLEDECKQP